MLLIIIGFFLMLSIAANVLLWLRLQKQGEFIKQVFASYVAETKEVNKRVEILAKIMAQYESVLKVLEQKKSVQIQPR